VKRKLLVKTRTKTGLGIIHKERVVADPARWLFVSMIQRAEKKMPSTSNSAESKNRPLNDKTTRTNSLWASFFLLSETMFRKLRPFCEILETGFQQALKKGVRCPQTVPCEQRRAEWENFGITANQRDCGETVLVSALYRVHIPCSHQFSIEVSCPILRDEM
jgi:hypothetical protein